MRQNLMPVESKVSEVHELRFSLILGAGDARVPSWDEAILVGARVAPQCDDVDVDRGDDHAEQVVVEADGPSSAVCPACGRPVPGPA